LRSIRGRRSKSSEDSDCGAQVQIRSFPVTHEIPPPVEAASAEQTANVIEFVDAAERCRRDSATCFFRANANERALILHNFLQTPLKASGANSSPARRTRHRDAGDGRIRRRYRKTSRWELGENLDPAGACHRTGGQRSRPANPWPAPPRQLDMAEPGFSSGCYCFSIPNSALSRELCLPAVAPVRHIARSDPPLIMLAAWRGSNHGGHAAAKYPARAIRRRGAQARPVRRPPKPVRRRPLPGAGGCRAQRVRRG